eukprot:g3702.t1
MVQIGVFERCRRRYGLEKTVLLGYLLVVIGLGSLVTWPDSSSLPQIFASAAVYGAGSALVSPALPALLVRFAPKGRTGAILGIDSAIVNFGRIVAPSLFGVFLFSDYAKLCLGGWSLCGRRAAAEEETGTAGGPKLLAQASTIPIRRVHLVFNAENVWANLQRGDGRNRTGVATSMSWDLSDTRLWKPLFRAGELRRLSGQPPAGEEDLEPSRSWLLEDAAEALKYQPVDVTQAARLESMLQSQLEQDVISHRAGLKGDGLDGASEDQDLDVNTRFNHVIGEKLGQLLEKLEAFSNCSRRHGGLLSTFPLRSSATTPV